MRLYFVRCSTYLLNYPTLKTMAIFTTLEKAYRYCDAKGLPRTSVIGIEPDTQEFGMYGEVNRIPNDVLYKINKNE